MHNANTYIRGGFHLKRFKSSGFLKGSNNTQSSLESAPVSGPSLQKDLKNFPSCTWKFKFSKFTGLKQGIIFVFAICKQKIISY